MGTGKKSYSNILLNSSALFELDMHPRELNVKVSEFVTLKFQNPMVSEGDL